MYIDFLLDSFQNNLEKEAIIWKEKLFNYQWILDRVHFWQKKTARFDNKCTIKKTKRTYFEQQFSFLHLLCIFTFCC